MTQTKDKQFSADITCNSRD